MAILLIYANILMSFEGWYDRFACSAKCVPSRPIDGEPKRWLIVNLVLILYSYSIVLSGLLGFTRSIWLSARNRIVQWDANLTANGADSTPNIIYPTLRFIFLAV